MPAPSASQDDRGPTAEEKLWRMRAIACELSLAGLDTHIHEAFTSIDVTATCRASGRRETEAIVDDDGYVELRFWTDPAATPAYVSALIAQALTAVAAPPAGSSGTARRSGGPDPERETVSARARPDDGHRRAGDSPPQAGGVISSRAGK